MSVIYAKLKQEEDQNILLFNEDQVDEVMYGLFSPPGLGGSIEYDAFGPQSLDTDVFHVDLSRDQWQKIEDIYVTDNKYADHVPSSDYEDKYARIDVIYRVTQEGISFKKIRPSQLAAQQGSLEWGEQPTFEPPSQKVFIDPALDLYINKSSKRAYFKSFRTASQIVRVLKEFFEETTLKHAEEMLAFDIFNISEFDVEAVSPRNQKRLARIKGDFDIDLDDSATIRKIQTYADRYEREGVFDGGRIKVVSNPQLTDALDVITGCFYENEITGDVMKATSSKKLD